jgi:hypothetical protein
VKPTTHLQLVPRSRKCGFIHPLPHTPSWCSAYFVEYRKLTLLHRNKRTYRTANARNTSKTSILPIFLMMSVWLSFSSTPNRWSCPKLCCWNRFPDQTKAKMSTICWDVRL